MATVTIVWSLCAAVAMMLAGACGLLWLIDRQNRASLMLCILGIAAAASTYAELRMMQSATTAEYGEWLRWYHLPIFITLTGQVLFAHYYLGTGRSWLMWATILARSVVLAVNFSVQPNFNLVNIVSLRHVSLLGEQISTIGGFVLRTQWQLFALASLILWMAYLVDAAVQRWREGGKDSRRKALAVCLGVAAPMLCTVMFSFAQVLVFNDQGILITNLLWYLGAVLTMAYQLGRDVMLGRRERLELVELRDELARVERVSVLGQLASALAHELCQPLAATAANVEAGLAYLKAEKPDLGELRSILGDIGNDDRRASEIISRMRQLFKRRTIEMQTLRLEDVLQDVVALVRSEMSSKQVALHLVMQPRLPRVFGDRVHLAQVLLNLLMNSAQALQSCPRDGRRIVIEARADDAKGEVEIAVKDSGARISAGIVDQLFKPFFTTKSEGMGIGLALSRTIIEAHGGRLWLDHSTGQDGTNFRFTLRPSLEPQPASFLVANSDPIPKGA